MIDTKHVISTFKSPSRITMFFVPSPTHILVYVVSESFWDNKLSFFVAFFLSTGECFTVSFERFCDLLSHLQAFPVVQNVHFGRVI